MSMFAKLNKIREREFKQWAHDNYKPGSEISGVWHPIVQAECVAINCAVFDYDTKSPREHLEATG